MTHDPLRYAGMTIQQLEEEKARIEAELAARRQLFRVVVDPSMPAGEMELVSGPHRLRVTNVGQ